MYHKNLTTFIRYVFKTDASLSLSHQTLTNCFGIKFIDRVLGDDSINYSLFATMENIRSKKRCIFHRNEIFIEELNYKDLTEFADFLENLISTSMLEENLFELNKSKYITEIFSQSFSSSTSLLSLLSKDVLKMALKILILCGSSEIVQNFLRNEANEKVDYCKEEFLFSALRSNTVEEELLLEFPHIADFINLENGDKLVHSYYKQSSEIPTFLDFLYANILIIYTFIILIIKSTFTKKLSWIEYRSFYTNKNHWNNSSKILASYWYGPNKSFYPAFKLLRESLVSKNLFVLIRAIDWSLFVLSHHRFLLFWNYISSFTIKLASYYAPFLVTDIKMHRSILLYYVGRSEDALTIQSELEFDLMNGSHNFNRTINLANAMRAALALGNLELINIIYSKSQNIPGFNSWPMRERTRLAFLIGQRRLVGQNVNFNTEINSLAINISLQPPLQRITSYLLLSIAYGESLDMTSRSKYLENCRQLLIECGLWNIYKRIYYAVVRNDILNRKPLINRFFETFTKSKNILKFQEIKSNFVGPHLEFQQAFHSNKFQLSSLTVLDVYTFFSRWIEISIPTAVFRCKTSDDLFVENYLLLPSIITEGQSKINSKYTRIVLSMGTSDLGIKWLCFSGEFGEGKKKDQFKILIPLLKCYEVGIIVSFLNRSINDLKFIISNLIIGHEKIEQVKREEDEKKEQALILAARQVSHDIRSPLTALNMILGQTLSLPEQSRILIRQSVNRINDIANSLLNQGMHPSESSISENKKLETTMLATLIDSVISEKRIFFRDKYNIQIESHLEKSYGLFSKINSTEMKRLISNAINNSAEAVENHKKGLIEIFLDSIDDKVILTIKDNGKGIPSHVLKKLGIQGVSHGKEGTQSGSGLGVYHAKKTIEFFGGSYEIKSSIDFGTSVVITLKKEEPPTWFVQKLSITNQQFVVATDDDNSILEIWRQRFTDLNINLITCTSGSCLKSWITKNYGSAKNALYLMDYEFLGQHQSGLDLIEELGLKEKAVLVSSRYEDLLVKERCINLGVKMIPKGMASMVPVEKEIPQLKISGVLIDDDVELVHAIWKLSAKELNIQILCFSDEETFLKESDNLDIDTPIYIDVNLKNNIRGQDVAIRLHNLGFKNLNLATGYDATAIDRPYFIRDVVGKNFPFGDVPGLVDI